MVSDLFDNDRQHEEDLRYIHVYRDSGFCPYLRLFLNKYKQFRISPKGSQSSLDIGFVDYLWRFRKVLFYSLANRTRKLVCMHCDRYHIFGGFESWEPMQLYLNGFQEKAHQEVLCNKLLIAHYVFNCYPTESEEDFFFRYILIAEVVAQSFKKHFKLYREQGNVMKGIAACSCCKCCISFNIDIVIFECCRELLPPEWVRTKFKDPQHWISPPVKAAMGEF